MVLIHYRDVNGKWSKIKAVKKGWYYYEVDTNKRIDNIFIHWIEDEKQ